MKLKPEHHEIVRECHARQRHLAATDPRSIRPWDRSIFEEQLEYGPCYQPSEWFGDIPNHIRQRYIRAIRDLEAAGMLTTWSRWGRKLTNIKVTQAGEAALLHETEATVIEQQTD